jgi:serine/threonine protein kinase
VWPHVDAERLSERVEAGGPLPPGDVVALLGHAAGALAACHARGVVHGALTPDCVAVAPDGLPRVLELGAGALLAQHLEADEGMLDSLSAAFAAAGVLAFAAPERAESPLALTPAGDQYALGAVGYFALTGLPPYPHPTLAEQLRAKRAAPPPSAAVVSPDVPAELAAVLERMLAPDPAARFRSLAEAEAALAALSFSGPLPPPEPAEVESLLLSRLCREAAESSGSISWAATGSGVLRPPARDGSDASIVFDLPDPPASPAEHSLALAVAPRPRAPLPSELPVPSGDPVMGNRLLGALNDGPNRPTPPPDPRGGAAPARGTRATTPAPASRPARGSRGSGCGGACCSGRPRGTLSG